MQSPAYEDLAQVSATEVAPQDSHIVIADIARSTQAINEGRYRDVNLVGAACIAAIRNGFDPRTVPYVFGGDGATFLVRDEHLKGVLERLFEVKKMAQQHFGFSLRVGSVRVGDLTGAEIRYGFLSWGDDEVLPFFRGNGIALAELIIKKASLEMSTSTGMVAQGDLKPEILKGLSCRLRPFLARRGRVLSVYIEPRVMGHELDRTFQQIFKVLGEKGPIARLSPLGPDNVDRPWISPRWFLETKLFRRSKSLSSTWLGAIQMIFQNIIATFFFRFRINNSVVGEPHVYNRYMFVQSDWIKMDGALRLVIDADGQEEAGLRVVLAELEYRKKIFFGIHCSDSAVMTCHLISKEGQRHVHFIDGKGGGLTRAAFDVKEKKRSSGVSTLAA